MTSPITGNQSFDINKVLVARTLWEPKKAKCAEICSGGRLDEETMTGLVYTEASIFETEAAYVIKKAQSGQTGGSELCQSLVSVLSTQ